MTIPYEPTNAALAAGVQALRDCGATGTYEYLAPVADSVWRAMAAEMNRWEDYAEEIDEAMNGPATAAPTATPAPDPAPAHPAATPSTAGPAP